MINNFERLKKDYIDNGIPVVISQVGVLTEKQKEPSSIREYLNAVFSMSLNYGGMMSCLWDTSKKEAGDMNYFNRETGEWYDEKIRDNFKRIARGKYIKPTEYYLISNSLTTTEPDSDGHFTLYIGKLKAVKAIFNAKIKSSKFRDCVFGITSVNKNGGWIGESIWCGLGEKQYDGTYIYTYDISHKDFNDNIQIQKWWGHDLITLNYFTLEFEENLTIIDYKSYKNDLEKLKL